MTRTPAEAFHPSVFIAEELEARGWSLDDLALRMPGDFGINRCALDFYMTIGAETPGLRIGESASALAAAFGVSPELFANLERAWVDHPTTKALAAKELN